MEENICLKVLLIGILAVTVGAQSSARGSGLLGATFPNLPATITDCYNSNNFYPSVRLQSSLDNLIYIVEKLETYLVSRNLPANASALATALLRRFQVNGISDVTSIYGSSSKAIDQNEVDKQTIIFSLLTNDTMDVGDSILTALEKCALHFMLSSSINTTLWNPDDPYNQQFGRRKRAVPWYTTDPDLWYLPRENGALFTGKFGTISGGPLLAGIAASSNLRTYRLQDVISNANNPDVTPYLQLTFDPLLVASIAGEIGQSALLYASPANTHAVFGPDGTWNGTNCATTYTLNSNETTYASVSELMGATDGFLIGNYLRNNFYQVGAPSTPFLSQVLRGYYGRGLQFNAISGCDRSSQLNSLSGQIAPSATAFAIMYKAMGARPADPARGVDYGQISNMMGVAVGNFSSTYLSGSSKFSCEQTIPVLPCQTENDIIVVMDTSYQASTDNFQEQKNFIGALIARIGVYPNASRVGVMTFGTSKEPIPWTETASGGDIRCKLQWSSVYYSTTDVPGTIRLVQDRFRSMKNVLGAANYAKVPGKVVIFIYMQTSGLVAEVDTAMQEFRREHPDVTTLAVGSNKNNLVKFVRDTNRDIFTSTGQQISSTIDGVVKRLCTVPRTLEYKNCRNPSKIEEDALIATDVVYQDTYQWVAMSDWTFNKSSDDLYFNVETMHGGAQICLSRTIQDLPFSTNCRDTSSQSAMQRFGPYPRCRDSPCNNWIYFSVKGKSGGQSDLCTELDCDSPTQIKYKITHEGVKCSASKMTTAFLLVILCFILAILQH